MNDLQLMQKWKGELEMERGGGDFPPVILSLTNMSAITGTQCTCSLKTWCFFMLSLDVIKY